LNGFEKFDLCIVAFLIENFCDGFCWTELKENCKSLSAILPEKVQLSWNQNHKIWVYIKLF
jgi:hypothetical protein